VKIRFKIHVFIVLFLLFLSNSFTYDQFITAKTSQEQHEKPHVWIVSPLRDQRLLASDLGNLNITGIASYNNSSKCAVFVNLNNQNVFRQATATGTEGRANYSIWKYRLDPRHDLIKEGINRLTAKISCLDSNSLQNSMNYTQDIKIIIPPKMFNSGKYLPVGPNIGALAAVAADNAILNGTIAKPESISSEKRYNDALGINIGALAAVAADKAIIDATITQLNGSAITTLIAKSTIHTGDNQSIIITVFDKLTKKALQEASVDGWVSDSSGITTRFFSGLTNASGALTSSWNIAKGTTPGKVTIFVEAYHTGYQRSTKSAFFIIKS
jgi:hypothetical protein